MEIRNAVAEDLGDILTIYKNAREFMKINGNSNQWGESYPPDSLIEDDISSGKCRVCTDSGAVVCVFYYDICDDETYRVIDGAWIQGGKYGVVHRIASSGAVKGAAAYSIMWAFEQCGNIRIDTHENNTPMRYLLNKLGFTYCGTIRISDGAPRRAYQKTRQASLKYGGEYGKDSGGNTKGKNRRD